MTMLNWDLARIRTYEMGIDHCVLYASGKPGVAWAGITQMQEIYSGFAVTSNHVDGIKYRSSVGRGEFKAKLSAYSSPEEFQSADGYSEIGRGLFATRQPRESFGLSYRTLIGNDVVGAEYGYKIHLIYNALAIPEATSRETMSASMAPTIKNWDISTVPYNEREYAYFRSGGDQTQLNQEEIVYRPVSHMVVDTRAVSPADINHLEEVLYGTDTTEPELPTPSELLEIIR